MEYDTGIMDSAYDALCREYGKRCVYRQDSTMIVAVGKRYVEVSSLTGESLVVMARLKCTEDDIFQFPVDEIADWMDIMSNIPVLIPSVHKTPDGRFYVPHYASPVTYKGSQDDRKLCSSVYEMALRSTYASECMEKLLHGYGMPMDMDDEASRTCQDTEG